MSWKTKCDCRLHSALLVAALLCLSTWASAGPNLRAKDGYIRREGDTWILGTSLVEKRVRLFDGHLSGISLRNQQSGRDYQRGIKSPEIHFFADDRDVTGDGWRWELRDDHSSQGQQGELELDVTLSSSSLIATKHYVLYPGTALIREWLSLENSSSKPVRIRGVSFWEQQIKGADDFKFNYVTGGGNFNGSQLLKTEAMGTAYQRRIDSNTGAQPLAYSGYLPLIFLSNSASTEGLAVGWDYLGHWFFEIAKPDSEALSLQLSLAGLRKDLPPGGQMETPKAFAMPYSGGVDELGNQILDWQYAYLWDFTNPEYFAKTRWAVDWPDPWVGDGGTPSADNWGRRLALDLRYVDLLRETGTDILWDDAGWYDKWGTWDGPDWRVTNDYVRKHNMRWVLWFPTFLATTKSKVAQQHSAWLIAGQDVLEQSIPATAVWQDKLLDDSVRAWGDYQWRYDIAPAVSANDSDVLDADQNFRKLLQQFKIAHPQSGIDACHGGGRWISYDIARFAESGEYTDGGVGPYSAYFTSLIAPPDKLHNVVDYDHIYYMPGTDRTHLGMNPTWYRDPGDGPDVEAIRKDWELYHYMVANGVAGRWGHVFRPRVEGDEAAWYFQRMDRDGSKGVILTKHEKHGATYYVTSRLIKAASGTADHYRGDAGNMNSVITSSAATISNAIYEDPVDGAFRFYGVPGQEYGPLNVKYLAGEKDASLATKIEKLGADRAVENRFFGMALQLDRPMTVTELGQFDPGGNQGIYELSVIRSDDDEVVAKATLDMGHAVPDHLGFKYTRLAEPIRLEADSHPVVIYPRGLSPAKTYDVRAILSGLHLQQTGSSLMQKGLALDKIAPGELIFLNLPNYPGAGTDRVPPSPPPTVSKRRGTNLGVQGVEISWAAGNDDNWLSYYEIRKNGVLLGRSAIGTFFFDHSESARNDIEAVYEVTAVDGDGNRSPAAVAGKTGDQPQVYEALGDFSPAQSIKHWEYEEELENGTYRHLRWDKGGYEGRWAGSGLGRIGRIWMQPSATLDLSRTFVVPMDGVVRASGEIRKDPSAENGASCFVRVLLNSKQVWPPRGWAQVKPDYEAVTAQRFEGLPVRAGDRLRFVVQHNGENRSDPILWNPRVTMETLKEASR